MPTELMTADDAFTTLTTFKDALLSGEHPEPDPGDLGVAIALSVYMGAVLKQEEASSDTVADLSDEIVKLKGKLEGLQVKYRKLQAERLVIDILEMPEVPSPPSGQLSADEGDEAFAVIDTACQLLSQAPGIPTKGRDMTASALNVFRSHYAAMKAQIALFAAWEQPLPSTLVGAGLSGSESFAVVRSFCLLAMQLESIHPDGREAVNSALHILRFEYNQMSERLERFAGWELDDEGGPLGHSAASVVEMRKAWDIERQQLSDTITDLFDSPPDPQPQLSDTLEAMRAAVLKRNDEISNLKGQVYSLHDQRRDLDAEIASLSDIVRVERATTVAWQDKHESLSAEADVLKRWQALTKADQVATMEAHGSIENENHLAYSEVELASNIKCRMVCYRNEVNGLKVERAELRESIKRLESMADMNTSEFDRLKAKVLQAENEDLSMQLEVSAAAIAAVVSEADRAAFYGETSSAVPKLKTMLEEIRQRHVEALKGSSYTVNEDLARHKEVLAVAHVVELESLKEDRDVWLKTAEYWQKTHKIEERRSEIWKHGMKTETARVLELQEELEQSKASSKESIGAAEHEAVLCDYRRETSEIRGWLVEVLARHGVIQAEDQVACSTTVLRRHLALRFDGIDRENKTLRKKNDRQRTTIERLQGDLETLRATHNGLIFEKAQLLSSDSLRAEAVVDKVALCTGLDSRLKEVLSGRYYQRLECHVLQHDFSHWNSETAGALEAHLVDAGKKGWASKGMAIAPRVDGQHSLIVLLERPVPDP